MPIPIPTDSESHDEFIQRCMSDEKMKDEYDTEQRYAVCENAFKTKLARQRISFDYDGTLSTKKGFDLAKELIKDNTLYIISARSSKLEMLIRASQLGIPASRVFATGSNKAKVEKVKELGINTHYDNNPDVIKELGNIGKIFNNG